MMVNQVPIWVCSACHGTGQVNKGRSTCRGCLGFGIRAEQYLTDREMAIQLQLRLKQVRDRLTPFAKEDSRLAELLRPRIYSVHNHLCPECHGFGFIGQGDGAMPCRYCRSMGAMMGNRPADGQQVLVPMRKYLAQLMAVQKKLEAQAA